MLVTVTQKDIDAGVPRRACACPIARAIGLPGLIVGPCDNGYWIVCDDDRYHVLPGEAGDFATRFDAGDPVAPFSFTLPAGVPWDSLPPSAPRPESP